MSLMGHSHKQLDASCEVKYWFSLLQKMNPDWKRIFQNLNATLQGSEHRIKWRSEEDNRIIIENDEARNKLMKMRNNKKNTTEEEMD
jgi:hypothetical protein